MSSKVSIKWTREMVDFVTSLAPYTWGALLE
jgi:hypothetical protein